MQRSEHINELSKALSQAQGEFPILQKRSQAYNYKYADLAEILDSTQKALLKHDLSIFSQVNWAEDFARLVTTLSHSSGQFVSTEIKIAFRADGKINEMQAMGSALTYARRYAISCLLNLAADKESDDDGVASGPKKAEEPKKVNELAPVKTINSYQAANLTERLLKFNKLDAVLSHYKIATIGELPVDCLPPVLNSIQKMEEMEKALDGDT